MSTLHALAVFPFSISSLITINAPAHCNDEFTIMGHKLIQSSAVNAIMLFVFTVCPCTVYTAGLVDNHDSQRQSAQDNSHLLSICHHVAVSGGGRKGSAAF